MSTLKIGEKVNGGYQIASMPFESEAAAKKWIKEYWGEDKAKAIKSLKDGKWYIASK